MLQGIIFDVDGTLAETEEVHRHAFNDAFSDLGLGWHWDRRLYGELLKVTGGKERLVHYIRNCSAEYDCSAGLSEFVRKIHALKTVRYTELVRQGAAVLRPGIERLLREARQCKIPLAISTTTSFANVDALLQATLGGEGLAMFDAICAGDSVANKKPAPDAYIAVLEQLSLPARKCIVIEDSENGLRAARAAGLSVIITKSLYTMHESFDDASVVLDNLESPCPEIGSPGAPIDVAALRRLIPAT